jgi:hypothetical protein
MEVENLGRNVEWSVKWKYFSSTDFIPLITQNQLITWFRMTSPTVTDSLVSGAASLCNSIYSLYYSQNNFYNFQVNNYNNLKGLLISPDEQENFRHST